MEKIIIVKHLVQIKFQDGEKKRYKAEQQRHELKQRKQLDELRMHAETTIKELEQLQVSLFKSIVQLNLDLKFYLTQVYVVYL